jgi:3'-phosphoadenosine 5'-phosphosulfate sulfotransferase (PAPS reductase)/FAD synthetase
MTTAVPAIRNAVRVWLEKYEAGDKVLVAVSGGADSLALAYALSVEGEKLAISVIGIISVGFILFKDTFIKKSQEFEKVEKLKQTRQCIGCNLKGADLTDLTTLKKSKEINCNDYYQRAAHAKACSYENFTKNLLYSSVLINTRCATSFLILICKAFRNQHHQIIV